MNILEAETFSRGRREFLRPATLPTLTGIAILAILGVSIENSSVLAEPPSNASTLRMALRYEHLPPQVEPLPPPTPERGLALEDLEQLALTSNPSTGRAAALSGAARGAWVQAGLLPNPSVGYEGQQLGSHGLAEQEGVLFSQDIILGGKLRLNRSVAEQEIVRTRRDLAAQRQRVLTDVRKGFYQVLVAQQQIELSNDLIRINRQNAQAVEALLRAQESSRVDLLQAQVEIENVEILAQNYHNRHEAAWRQLASVVGNPQLTKQPLIGDALAPPMHYEFSTAFQQLRGASPEIAASVAEINRARAVLERARVEPIPNVSFQGLYNWQDNGIGGRPDGGVTVTVPVPIFDRNQGAVMRAQQEFVAAQHALQQLELDLQNRFALVFERYANARNQVERYRDRILPAAQESLELTRRIYEAGEANYLLLLTAQRTYSQTHLNYLEAIQALRVAEAEIQGQLLWDSLANRGTAQ